MTTKMKTKLPDGLEIYADLPGFRINGGTVPADTVVTGERPDIVILNRETKHIILLELTTSFETNVRQANIRETIRYSDLKCDLTE